MTTYRKSWIAYLKPGFGILASIGLIAYAIAFWFFRAQWLSEGHLKWLGLSAADLQDISTLWFLIPLLGFIGGFFLSILGIVNHRMFRLDVEENLARVQYGILPWDRTDLVWTKQHIYNCMFYQQGFLGWALAYGDIEIVGREGATKHFRYDTLHRAKEAAAAINAIALKDVAMPSTIPRPPARNR